MLALTFSLLVVYQLKHYVADFLLQGKYMLGKFKPGWGYVLPLSAHCGVHALFTLMIVYSVNPQLWWLAIVDFVVHFIMDRIKASPKMLGRFQALSKKEMIHIMKFADRDPLRERDLYPELPGDIERRQQLRSNVLFWWSLGLDQMVHCLTHYFIIYMLVQSVPEDRMFDFIQVGLLLLMSPLVLPILILKALILGPILYKFVVKSNKEVFKQ